MASIIETLREQFEDNYIDIVAQEFGDKFSVEEGDIRECFEAVMINDEYGNVSEEIDKGIIEFLEASKDVTANSNIFDLECKKEKLEEKINELENTLADLKEELEEIKSDFDAPNDNSDAPKSWDEIVEVNKGWND